MWNSNSKLISSIKPLSNIHHKPKPLQYTSIWYQRRRSTNHALLIPLFSGLRSTVSFFISNSFKQCSQDLDVFSFSPIQKKQRPEKKKEKSDPNSRNLWSSLAKFFKEFFFDWKWCCLQQDQRCSSFLCRASTLCQQTLPTLTPVESPASQVPFVIPAF